MRKLLLPAVALLALATSTTTFADVQLRVQMGFPVVLPPLVEVQPGVRVVQDFDEEVFFIGGYYWAQRDGNWYRARDHRGTWRYVKPGALPPALVHHEPGRYRRWQHDERRTWPEARNDRRSPRHWKPADHQERRQPPQQAKQEHPKKGNDHDRGGHGRDPH